MNQEASTSSIPKVQVPTRYRRKLDHMGDLADGGLPFDMIPRKLSRAFIEGDFPVAKFRLLLCMMSHAGGFHVKRAYLEKRFDSKTLQKYVKELIDEGYIEVETVSREGGGVVKLYHVRSVQYWAIYSQSDDTLINGDRQIDDTLLRGGREEGVLKETNSEKSNSTHITRTRDEPQQKQVEKSDRPTYGSDEQKQFVEWAVGYAREQGLRLDPNVLMQTVGLVANNLRFTVEEMRELWPFYVIAIMERNDPNPAAKFFQWAKTEQQAKLRQRQRDQNRDTKGFHRGKSRGTTVPTINTTPEQINALALQQMRERGELEE